MARRVKTSAMAVRYSRSAWMSELTVRLTVASAAAAATTSEEPSVPMRPSSTAVAR